MVWLLALLVQNYMTQTVPILQLIYHTSEGYLSFPVVNQKL